MTAAFRTWLDGPAAREAGGAMVIPTGSYRIDAALDRRIRESTRAPGGDGGLAHPIFAFVAALGGLGVPVADICRMCGSSIEAGPLLAQCAIRYRRALVLDRLYAVSGAIVGRTTKPSRRFGSAEHVSLHLCVGNRGHDADYREAADAEVWLTWIMPQARTS